MRANVSRPPNSSDNLLSRSISLLTQPVFLHHCSILISPSTSPLSGSVNPSLNRSLNHFLFLLFQHTRVLRYSSHFQDQSDTGDVIGWKDDNNTVGPIAVAAKQSLLRLIPHIIPTDSGETSLSSRSRPRRFRRSQHVDYNECKRSTPHDVPIRLGDWMHCAGYFI